MQNKCCDCEYLDRNDVYKDWYGKATYKCKYKRQYKKLDDDACSNFKALKINTSGYTPSGCFITTIVCDVLGYEDDCELLTLLRDFRDNVLKINPYYLPLLMEYDKVGPLISECIIFEPNNHLLCHGLMKYFLIPCANEISQGKYEEAISIYKNMVMYLNDSFDLPEITINVNEKYDFDSLGKGRILQKN